MDQFFRVPFAVSGDQTPIPQALDPSGFVSFTNGYGFDYQRNVETDPDAKAIERDKMNFLFFAITKAVRDLQTLGAPEWITSADNGGTPYEYEEAAIVRHEGAVWQSRVSANDSEPGTDPAKWALLSITDKLDRVGGTVTGLNSNGFLREVPVVADTGTDYVPDLAGGTLFFLTLTGNWAPASFPTPTAGRAFSAIIKQDGTGGRTITLPSSVRKGENATDWVPTATANRADAVTFVADGTYWVLFVSDTNINLS